MSTVAVGDAYGMWTVVTAAEPLVSGKKRKRKLRRWLCRCDCGNERRVLEKNLKNGGSTGCGCQLSYGIRWTDELIEERLREHSGELGRMPTSVELCEREGDSALATIVGRRGGYRVWAYRIGLPLSGGTVHRGAAWEDHEERFFRELGLAVVRQRTKAVFDLLVAERRVDVKSARWSAYARGATTVRGYVFGNLRGGTDCDFFDLLCIEDGAVAHRFIIPSSATRVQTLTITERTLGGFGKYSEWRDRIDLLSGESR